MTLEVILVQGFTQRMLERNKKFTRSEMNIYRGFSKLILLLGPVLCEVGPKFPQTLNGGSSKGSPKDREFTQLHPLPFLPLLPKSNSCYMFQQEFTRASQCFPGSRDGRDKGVLFPYLAFIQITSSSRNFS